MNNNLICARIVIDITADLIKTTWTYKLPDLLTIFQQYIYSYLSFYISLYSSSLYSSYLFHHKLLYLKGMVPVWYWVYRNMKGKIQVSISVKSTILLIKILRSEAIKGTAVNIIRKILTMIRLV